MLAQTTIPARFNGPPTSGNGGYSCGLLAAHIGGSAKIRLHVPPPLDTEMRFADSAAGGIEMYDGDTLVGSAEPAPLNLEIPEPPTLSQAREAMRDFPCYEGHLFPTCFVCGPQRSQHDGLELFPGPLPGSNLWACVWRPGEDLLNEVGKVRTEIVWSALDCPGYFASLGSSLRPAVLGELAGEVMTPVPGESDLIVYAWPLGEEGRKIYAGTAIATADGQTVACARSIWIALKD
jgi:hypothetical protein